MTDQDEKRRLIAQMGSSDNDEALAAARTLRERGWLTDGSLRGSYLRGANLQGAELSKAVLTKANMGVSDLSGAQLRGADLREADLHHANLDRADLSGADLFTANLHSANLYGANLSVTILTGTDLSRADLSYADLYGADLSVVHLRGAKMHEANLAKSVCELTMFADIDLSTVKGLEAVQHRGPSNVDVFTLYKSKGKIPEVFLRGCGVPEEFIAYTRGLFGKVIDFYSCFISYSHADEAFANQLHSRLQNAGLRVWYAPEDVAGGKKLHEQIYHAIDYHDRLLVVLSDHSIHSEWVMTEIRRARKLEVQQKRRKLFPIRLTSYDTLRDWECFDADTGKDLAIEVREYFIPDFSDWQNPEAFEPVFQRLLKDLKAADTD